MASSTDSPVEVTVNSSSSNSSPVMPELAVYRQWLQQLSSPIDELKGKIRETQESITAEKRKSLSRRTTGGGKNNRNNSHNNRNQSNQNGAAEAAAANQRIEVMENLLTVFRQELATIESFVKVVAVFVIKNSPDSADDESLVSLLQPYQPMLKGLAPKNTLQVKNTPIRRNSSKRSSGRRNRNRRSNSQSRSSPDKLKMNEIISALKADQQKEGSAEKEQAVDVLAEREKLLTLKYFGGHFADTLKVDGENVEPKEVAAVNGQEKVAAEKSADVETPVSIESKDEETIEIPIPDDKSEEAADLVEPKLLANAEATQLKDDDNSEQTETVIENQQADHLEAAVAKSYAEAAGAEHTASTSIPKFTELVDPLPSKSIVSVADQSEEVEKATSDPATQPESNTEAAANQRIEGDKSSDAEVTREETAETTATASENGPVTDIPEPKVETNLANASTELPETPEKAEGDLNSSASDDATATSTEPPPATITKSESTILNENPLLALPVIGSPILPRAEFATVSEPVAAVPPTEESSAKPVDVISPPSPTPTPSPPLAVAETTDIEADKKEEAKVNNTEIFDRIVEAAEKAKEKTTLLKPSESVEKGSAVDNQYGTFSEPKAEVAVQQTEESKVVDEVPEPAAVKTDDLEVTKPETPKPAAPETAKQPPAASVAAKNGTLNNNKTGLKKRSSAKKEKKSKSGKRSAANNNGTNAGRSKPKSCCSIM